MENKIKRSFDRTTPDQKERMQMFDKISEEAKSNQKSHTYMQRKQITRILSIACMLVIVLAGTSGFAYATVKWLTPGEVAELSGDEKLASEFGKQVEELKEQTWGDYRILYLGAVSGKNISSNLMEEDIDQDKTYIAVAIEPNRNVDIETVDVGGSDIIISPFIEGEKPWQCNVFTLDGSSTGNIKDGIVYRLVEVDGLQKFADRQLYLGVFQFGSSFPDLYHFDESTGLISRNTEYDGLNCLFEMKLDPSKADPKAAEEYLKQMYGEEESNANETKPEDKATVTKKEATDLDSLRKGLDLTDQGIEYHLWQCNGYSKSSADEKRIQAFYDFYVQVEGNDIESITYTLNHEEFLKKTEVSREDARKIANSRDDYEMISGKDWINTRWNADCDPEQVQFIGDPEKESWVYTKAGTSYTVDYEKQNTNENVYAISVETSIPEYKSENMRSRITEDAKAFNQEMEDLEITVSVRKTNGEILEHTIVFKKTAGLRDTDVMIPQWKQSE